MLPTFFAEVELFLEKDFNFLLQFTLFSIVAIATKCWGENLLKVGKHERGYPEAKSSEKQVFKCLYEDE